MIRKTMYQRIQFFKMNGYNKSEIVRETGLDWKTVSKYFNMEKEDFTRYLESTRERHKIFDPFKETILELFGENKGQNLQRSAIYDYLEEKHGKPPGTERSLRNYVEYLIDSGDLELCQNRRSYEPVPQLPYGKQMQLDFGEYRIRCGIKLYIFAAVLSASRYKYVYFQEHPFKTLDLLSQLLACFTFYSGMPEELAIDQDSLMVVSENHGDILYTKDFKHFIDEMDLQMFVCRKSDPESKGKIENVIKYVKYNFLSTRNFSCSREANRSVRKWLNRRGNGRICAATKRIPAKMFEEEQAVLRPERHSIYSRDRSHLREERQVDKESWICVNSSKYPVPQQYRHKTVEIYLTNESLIVLDPKTGEEIIAHRLCVFPGSTVVRPDREDRNQKKRDQLRLELFGMFESRDWKRFVIKNFKRFERYFRDQYHEAKAKFGKGIEPEPLERALKFCLETDTLSMAQLKDSYDYFKRELESQGSVVPFANRVQKSTLSDRNIKLPQVKTRGLSVYLDLIQNGTREVSA